jgi:hypothetical protein
MAIVKVIMMQRDEGDALARWITHYSGLVGYDNLHIMDNGSKDELTLAILREAEFRGSHLHRGLDRVEDFHDKNVHIGNIIRHLDQTQQYDFVLPVDCDEILAVFTDKGLTADHSAIHAEFDRLKATTSAIRIDMSLFNVPGRSGWFAPVKHFHKGFLPAYSFESIDTGQHEPKSKLAEGFRHCRFAYLHWHNKPYAQAVEAAQRKLEKIVDIHNRKAVKAYFDKPGVRGVHLRGILLDTEEEYLKLYDKSARVYVPPAGDTNLLDLGYTVTLWDAESYLRHNHDVRRYELTALHHFLTFGYDEGRQLRPWI